MSEKLPLEQLAHWLALQPDTVWLRQPINGQWHDLTWRQVDDQARRLASALLALGCVPGDRVALLAKNCAEWFISDLAIMQAGLVSVPLYPLQSAESIAYVLEHAQCKVIVLGKLDDADKLEAGIGPQVTRIAMPYPTLACAHDWHSLLAMHEPLQRVAVQQPEQLLTLVYTSGTTGNPKGVMLSARAMGFAAANACTEMHMTPQDRFFSFLPLSHVAERFMVEFNSLYCGAPVAFVESMETFASDLRYVRPTTHLARHQPTEQRYRQQ